MWVLTRNLEKPTYKIVKALSKEKSWLHSGYVAEVRRYDSYIVAEVTLEDEKIEEALSNGFRQIGNYIFGNNTKAGAEAPEKVAMTSPVALDVKPSAASEKVAMTAPVAAELSQGKKTVAFMMPREYTLDTLPRPNNPAVSFREVPPRTLAAITFAGRGPREDKVEKKKSELLDLLEEAGLKAAEGPVMLWQYHPPFCPPWQRRNEVLLPVEGPVAAPLHMSRRSLELYEEPSTPTAPEPTPFT